MQKVKMLQHAYGHKKDSIVMVTSAAALQFERDGYAKIIKVTKKEDKAVKETKEDKSVKETKKAKVTKAPK